ncbi:hypothetical protein BC831DRAFT_107459 [Entophlyctis helioformis]|nr:hypothetical protein BC831DRAFT_107459 [Entophlyctis helioformis]
MPAADCLFVVLYAIAGYGKGLVCTQGSSGKRTRPWSWLRLAGPGTASCGHSTAAAAGTRTAEDQCCRQPGDSGETAKVISDTLVSGTHGRCDIEANECSEVQMGYNKG